MWGFVKSYFTSNPSCPFYERWQHGTNMIVKFSISQWTENLHSTSIRDNTKKLLSSVKTDLCHMRSLGFSSPCFFYRHVRSSFVPGVVWSVVHQKTYSQIHWKWKKPFLFLIPPNPPKDKRGWYWRWKLFLSELFLYRFCELWCLTAPCFVGFGHWVLNIGILYPWNPFRRCCFNF